MSYSGDAQMHRLSIELVLLAEIKFTFQITLFLKVGVLIKLHGR